MSFRLFSLTSISGRIALMSLALNAFVLLMVALYLSASYRADVVAGFDRSLENYGAAILTELAESIGEGNDDRVSNPDPRYNTPLSGWYWQLMREDGQLERTSRSLFGTVLDDLPLDALDTGRNFSFAYLTGAGEEDMRMAARFVTFEGRNETFIFVITGDFSLARAAASRFMANTLSTLLVIGLILSLSTLLLVRFGLRPLKLIGTRLYDIREGRSSRLGTGFADEIAPLAGEMDGLLDYNEKLIERARRHVGNLAHGLKTPLAVLANHANENRDDKVLKAEVGNMQRQIDNRRTQQRN